MNKMIVTVYDNEEQAAKGLGVLKDLHADGDITLHATSVIHKDETGKVVVKEESDDGPIGTSLGMLSGMLIGILGGPSGMVMGASGGAMGGMYFDLDRAVIDAGFVDEVSAVMTKGKTAIVADVEEGWTEPVDSKMADLDVLVFRKNRYEVVDDLLNREADEINAELEELEEELRTAKGEMKDSIQKQKDRAIKKKDVMKGIIEKKLKEARAERKAKIEALEIQIEAAKTKNRKKLEKRKADLKAKYKMRKQKLKAAQNKVFNF